MTRKQNFQSEGVRLGLAPRSAPEDGNSVSRGYTKLSNAAEAFGFDFHDKVVLDIGSSTGGFTQYALDHGAKKVIAIEKGTNQMQKPLRFDHRIDLHEKTDIFNVETQIVPSEGIRSLARRGRAPVARGDGPTGRVPKKATICASKNNDERPEEDDLVVLNERIDVILADVSFLSLTTVLKHAKSYLSDSHTEFLVMLKPQFEARPHHLNNGIVKNEKIRRKNIKNFELWLKTNGFIIVKKRDNSLKGKNGNIERFYLLTFAKHKLII